jgi:hypothetical protein
MSLASTAVQQGGSKVNSIVNVAPHHNMMYTIFGIIMAPRFLGQLQRAAACSALKGFQAS